MTFDKFVLDADGVNFLVSRTRDGDVEITIDNGSPVFVSPIIAELLGQNLIAMARSIQEGDDD